MTRRLPRHHGATIQHVSTSLDMGGAQTMLVKLIEAEPRHGGSRHAIVSMLKPGVLTPSREEAPVYTLGMARGLPGPAAIVRLLRITGRVRPDLLQGWMYHGNLAASIAGALQTRGTPVVWNVRHSLVDLALESRATRRLIALSARLSRGTAAIVYNSQVAARQHEAVGFAPERSIYIANGFDCGRFRPDPAGRTALEQRFGVPPGPIVVAMVARLHPMKDHATLVDAVARARAAGVDLHLLLVGTGLDGPPRALADRIARQIPSTRVTLVGERTDVAEWLPGVDIVALSSAWGEAFPNILGEAMACGIPCVATDVGDSAWVLGESGTIVPPGDVTGMAAALVRLGEDGATERHGRGIAARARVVDEFEIDSVARRYRQLYSAILRGDAVAPQGRTTAACRTEQMVAG
ncbi:glycosyltransferase [Sphingomonas sp. SUN019]|uniref:glycosyltransferase n=1 Tax=Sphingomonas sp. SUN019 TaxID=2937788 RepID=UPI0021642011|nr:glycosyltransferase [Sphingomonas sp. SUN019]UVO51683.1 glycosyltransferase [Sphingomonas sp. SUN019]